MGKKSPPPKPPDLTPISNAQIKIAQEANEVAREQLGLSRDQFEYFKTAAAEELALAKEQADRMFGLQQSALESDQQAKDFAMKVGQTQIDAMLQQMGYAEEDRARYKDVFLPLQDQYIAEAQAYDTPDRREAEAARQMVDIQRQAEAQRANADARLRSMGVDPSQVRSTSMMDQLGTMTAANQALAGNMGRQNIEDRGRAMREAAINLGNGLPAQSLAGYAGATGAGNSAVGAGMAGQGATLNALGAYGNLGAQGLAYRQNALSSMANLTGSPTQWASLGNTSYNTAGNQYNNAANTLTQGFNNQMSSWNAGQQQAQQNFSNIMSVGSMAAGMFMAEGGAVAKTAGKAFDVNKIGNTTKTGGKDSQFIDRAKEAFTKLGEARKEEGGNEVYNPGRQSEVVTKQIYMAEGGSRAIPVRQTRDKIPALLTEGEYVLPADVVRAIGLEKLDKMVSKYHRSNA